MESADISLSNINCSQKIDSLLCFKNIIIKITFVCSSFLSCHRLVLVLSLLRAANSLNSLHVSILYSNMAHSPQLVPALLHQSKRGIKKRTSFRHKMSIYPIS